MLLLFWLLLWVFLLLWTWLIRNVERKTKDPPKFAPPIILLLSYDIPYFQVLRPNLCVSTLTPISQPVFGFPGVPSALHSKRIQSSDAARGLLATLLPASGFLSSLLQAILNTAAREMKH